MSESPPDPLMPAAKEMLRIVRTTFRLQGAILRHGDELFSSSGLSSSRVQVIVALRDGPRTVPEIARGMGLTRQGVQRTVHVLTKEGLLETKKNPEHKRSSLIYLTPKGRRRLLRVTVSRNRFLNDWSREHQAGDLKQLADLIERLDIEMEQYAQH